MINRGHISSTIFSLRGMFLIIFFFVFASISLVNHYNFRTYSLDLGIYNNALYDFSHFRANDYSIMDHMFRNILSDHFSLIPFLVSPLYWIFDSYTMLIFQIFIILFGSYGIYKIVKLKSETKYIPELAMLHFLGIWGIYSALSFDYHDNVVAAMLLPWFFYFLQLNQWKKAIAFFILILIAKENMAFWCFFICIGSAIHYYKDKVRFKRLLLLAVISVSYFWLVVNHIMPFFRETAKDTYLHFNFDVLGSNFKEAIVTVVNSPLKCLRLLFVSPFPDADTLKIKEELHFMVLVSGGYALLFRPYYLIMLIPIYAQKLWNNDFTKWGINNQYSIEFVPVLTLSLFTLICTIERKNIAYLFAAAAIILTFSYTFVKLEHRVSLWYNPEQSQFYSKAHYVTPYNVKEVYRVLKLIPEDARVSASPNVVPHLCNRETIYGFPKVNDANYVLILNYYESAYPLSMEELREQIRFYSNSPDWSIVYNNHGIGLFKKVRG
ncbi:MAG: DUF2079 domain-containing protein [Bacteroidia bacterium]